MHGENSGSFDSSCACISHQKRSSQKMTEKISGADIRRAQFPHNLFISGLFLFDLLMAPAAIGLKLGMAGMLIPLSCSGALLAFIHLRSKKTTHPFVDAHWQLASRHGRWLLGGYGVSALLIFIAWLISLAAQDAHMGQILWSALTRIALLPTLIMVMVTSVMEASALGVAGKGEMPAKISR